MGYITVSLYDYIDDSTDIQNLLKTFSCPLNLEEESFLKDKAIDFERKHFARTYLVFSDTFQLPSLLGYFTVALKHLAIPIDISKSFRKTITGYIDREEAITYLIGQLGRNCAVSERISGSDLMTLAIAVIYDVYLKIGGRIILVECENQEKLRFFYENQGFRLLCSNIDNNLLQYVSTVKSLH